MDGHGPAVLHVTPEVGPRTVWLRLAGEMDVATAGHLTEVVRSLPADRLAQVRLDLSGLAFVDAAGLTALLQVEALVRAHDGRLTLHGPSPLILRLLAITGLTGLFDIDSPIPTDR